MTNINPSDFLTCRCCNQKIHRKYIGSAYIRADNTFSECKVCSWIKRNKQIINKQYSQSQIRDILVFFYNEGGIYLNEFAEREHITIDDAIKLFQFLRIANKKCLVKTYCEYCGNKIESSPSAYLSTNNHYCCNECYWKDKTNKIKHGEESPFYDRVETNCTNCGVPLKIIPYQYKKKNSFGDNHNFCCYQCYWNYRSKYYIGEKSVNWEREYTEEQHKKMSTTAVMNARKTKTRDTKIQLSINEILNKNNIRYEREYLIGFMQIDNYLYDYNLMIEVQGDYWHVNPLKYNQNGILINDTQVKDIIQDKRKHTMLKNKGINILYVWESDIKNNIELCEKLILKYIESNGILENYNSFNWECNDDKLTLKNEITYPYQELPFDECKKIIKQKVG